MKIAHLTTVDMSLRYLLLPQLEAATDIGEVVGISAPGPYVEDLESRGIRHVPLAASTRGLDFFRDMRSAAQLWRVLKTERPDILHTHNPKPGIYGRIVGRLVGVPMVINTVHGLYASSESPIWKRLIVYGLEWLASRFSDAELVQNPEDLELLIRLRITPKARTTLLGNGVDLDRFKPEAAAAARDAMRRELNVGPDTIVVGMVGRLVAEKGIPELIEAASGLGERYRVVIAGPGDPEKSDALLPEVVAQAEEIGVTFLGMRSDIDRLYGLFDMFVLPSHREGFPRAAMEAAASGLPVVATDIRGCRQVVEAGVNGYLVPLADAVALKSAIEALGDDLALRRRMAVASADRARRHFDEREVVRRVMSTYRDVAVRKGFDWMLADASSGVSIREAVPADATAFSELHRSLIPSAFLSSLGPRFLRVLYRAMIASSNSHVVAASIDGAVVGFIAGSRDTSAFLKGFVSHRRLPAAWAMFPKALRPSVLKGIVEILSHGGRERAIAPELLSMAVAPIAQGRGIGRRLVEELIAWAVEEGIHEMRVVVGADNEPAIGLYESCGFADRRTVRVHGNVESWEMVWRPRP